MKHYKKIWAILVLLLVGINTDCFASRYQEIELSLSDAIVINNAKKVLGRDENNDPYIVEIVNDIPDPKKIELIGIDNKEIHVTDINSTGDDQASEIISGWYVDLEDKKHGVIWKNTEGTYLYEVLPPYTREQNICLGNARTDAVDCIQAEDITSTLGNVATTQGCDNSAWADWTEGKDYPASSIVTECDEENIANGVNDNGIVIGTSYRQNENSDPRPIFWQEIEKASPDPNTEPEKFYLASDLSVRIENRVRIATAGLTEKIDRHGNSVSGELWNDVTSRYEKVVWQETASEATGNTSVTITQNDGSPYDGPIAVTSLSSFGISGWYANTSAQTRPVIWNIVNNEAGERVFSSKDVATLVEDGGFGRSYQINNFSEIVGSSGQDPSSYRGFLSTRNCGTQNLNELLATPNSDVILDAGRSITTGLTKNYILASGHLVDDIGTKFYVLKPTEVQVDLSVSIASDHESLIVGEEHTYTVNIQNKGTANQENDNYATCVNVDITPDVTIKDPSGDFVKSGGLTILSASSNGSARCTWTPIAVNCFISKLDPGESSTVTLLTQPRAVLAGRDVNMTAKIESTETLENANGDITPEDNKDVDTTAIQRQGCFIATAAYGSYFEPHVKTLREFRDKYLLTNNFGQFLVDTYYTYSPPLADYIHDRPLLKTVIRATLTPLVFALENPFFTLFLISGIVALWTQRKSFHPVGNRL